MKIIEDDWIQFGNWSVHNNHAKTLTGSWTNKALFLQIIAGQIRFSGGKVRCLALTSYFWGVQYMLRDILLKKCIKANYFSASKWLGGMGCSLFFT
jgi:hypothetical protein